MHRVARDVSIQLYRRGSEVSFLMLRRVPARGGFWQPVTGAPLPGEPNRQAAIREVQEETGWDVTSRLRSVANRYAYALDDRYRERWDRIYGAEITSIEVVSFSAEAPPGGDPTLDPAEHDGFRWCSYDEAYSLLDWPVEPDALVHRREVLRLTEAFVTGLRDRNLG